MSNNCCTDCKQTWLANQTRSRQIWFVFGFIHFVQNVEVRSKSSSISPTPTNGVRTCGTTCYGWCVTNVDWCCYNWLFCTRSILHLTVQTVSTVEWTRECTEGLGVESNALQAALLWVLFLRHNIVVNVVMQSVFTLPVVSNGSKEGVSVDRKCQEQGPSVLRMCTERIWLCTCALFGLGQSIFYFSTPVLVSRSNRWTSH
jgi:hypothetical protein